MHFTSIQLATFLLAASLTLLARDRPAARLVLVAGGTNSAPQAPAREAVLKSPFGVDFDPAGRMIIVEMTGERVSRVEKDGSLSRIAGTGVRGFGGDGAPAARAQFAGIHNLAVAPNGDIYLADTWNNRVRKISGTDGSVATVAGTGRKGFSGDGGPATQAEFGGIYCVSLDPDATALYCADLDNRRIRKIDLKTGIVRTVAGNGAKGVPPDGALAIEAPLVDPRAVIANRDGSFYILERGGHALRQVDAGGRIRTVVGTGQKGSTGDGGDGRQATLNSPKHLCFDRNGDVLIADSDNHLIRRFNPRTGWITRVAGNGRRGTSGLGGPPEEAELNQPHGVHVHRDGTLYIADSSNGRVLKLAP